MKVHHGTFSLRNNYTTSNWKGYDENYETDYNQLITTNVFFSDKDYWFASRNVYSESDTRDSEAIFDIRNGGEPPSVWLTDGYICYVTCEGEEFSYSNSFGLRPVFSLRSDVRITGGEGTEASPYVLSK